MKKQFCKILAFIIMNIPSAYSVQNDIVTFKYLSIEEGLSESHIDCIFQDYEGFIWVGTHNGLNRFDGYEFVVYKYSSIDTHSLSSNVVNVVYEDRQRNIWIGTEGGGLNKYNRDFGTFARIPGSPKDPNDIGQNNIRAIYEDRAGVLWVGTLSGLFVLNREQNLLEPYYVVRAGKKKTFNLNVLKIIQDRSGNLWIGTDIGLCAINLNENKVISVSENSDSVMLFKARITGIMEDKYGAIWACTRYSGVYKYVIGNKSGTGKLFHFRNDPANKNSLSNDETRGMVEDKSGFLWIATEIAGICKYDQDKKIFTRYLTSDLKAGNDLATERIRCVYKDKSDMIWLGTAGKGVIKIIKRNSQFKFYKKEAAISNTLSDNSVLSFQEDEKGILFIGTEFGGLTKYDQKTGTFIQYPSEFRIKNDINKRFMRCIWKDHLGILWFGTNRGLRKLQIIEYEKGKRLENFINYYKKSSVPSELLDNIVLSVYGDHRGNLWIGTAGGLSIFDKEKERMIPIRDNQNLLKGSRVVFIREDQRGTLWLCTLSGLLSYDRDKCVLKKYPYDFSGKPTGLANSNISSFYEDRGGNIWLGTEKGLFKVSAESFNNNKFRPVHYSEKTGFTSSVILGILEDDFGNLWVSTQTGLSKFNPLNESVRNYSFGSELPDIQFHPGSCYRSSNGKMFFGGAYGMIVFHPDSIHDINYIPTTVITHLKINNNVDEKAVFTQKKLQSLKSEIVLSYEENFFSLEFATLDFNEPESNQYIYKLAGFDNDWVYCGTRNYAQYTNVKPGNYLFSVKGRNQLGIWSENEASVNIIVLPPFWQTWWFRVSIVIAGFLSIVLIFRIRTKAIRKRNQELNVINVELNRQIIERRQAEEALRIAHAEVGDLKDRLQAENIYLRAEIEQSSNFDEIVGDSERIKDVLIKVEQVAKTDSTVLLFGETGTGKELIARTIHNNSLRKERPLVKVNCATIPSELVESELFGHEKGAFTTAIKQHIGKFELAEGGTIFLDEIGDLPLNVQVKILHVLQDKKIERVGGNKTINVHVRIIAATNSNLEKDVEEGKFRSDLYYRLNVFPISLPPLRERNSDIPVLTDLFLRQYSKSFGKDLIRVSKATESWMKEYSWPGNIRELQNVIERAAIIADKPVVSIDSLMKTVPVEIELKHKNDYKNLEELERENIMRVLKATNWIVGGEHGAAALLGLKRSTLQYKIKKFNISKQKY